MEKQKKKATKKKEVVKDEKVLTKEEEKMDSKKKEVKKEKKKDKKEKKTGFFKSIFNFFKSVKTEMAKVTWPSKKNMFKYSIATIIFILFFALYFYGIEVIMAWLKSVIVVI